MINQLRAAQGILTAFASFSYVSCRANAPPAEAPEEPTTVDVPPVSPSEQAVNSKVQAASGEGPCEAWSKQVCEGAGDESHACNQAKEAGELLPDEACETALNHLPATLEKVKAARANCDRLVSKLCEDLGKETKLCQLVTERTQSFPPKRCNEMLENYDNVLGQLKAMEGLGGPRDASPDGAGP